MLDKLAALSNDVGLFAEEYDPVLRQMLGNFPQAFSHVGLINSALNLHRSLCRVPAREPHDSAPRDDTNAH